MRKVFFLCILFFSTSSHAQRVSDILEHGKVVKDKEGVYLQLQTDKLFFETGAVSSSNFDPLKNETFFLIKGGGANINIRPLNPIIYSTSVEITFQPDAINAAAADALKSIIASLGNLAGQGISADAEVKSAEASYKEAKFNLEAANALASSARVAAAAEFKGAKAKQNKITAEQVAVEAKEQVAARKEEENEAKQKLEKVKAAQKCINELEPLIKVFKELAALLEVDKKTEIVAIFKSLKDLGFLDKEDTKAGIDDAKGKRDSVAAYYKYIKTKLDAVSPLVKEYGGCDEEAGQTFINVYVLNQMLKDAQSVYQTFVTRLSNLDKIYALVNKTYTSASGTGTEWFVLLKRASMQDEKIATSSVTIYNDGYELSADNEIVKGDKKELVATTLKFRKFQKFVPEVSAGIAYTQLSYPKYATETDAATGKLRVADAGKEEFKQVNFTSMINFNFYFPNSPIHPFWQIGIGANADYPTLLTGVGIRLNVGLQRLAISTGFAGTWIKSLQTLEVGKGVESDAALEKDLKHEFSFPLKPYIGIQMNF